MKRVMQLGIVWLALIVLCGCSVVSRQEGKNITLSAEHEALCNSKNTLNKKLCRQTMGQLPKFESDINTYFKEKFDIDGFKLTGIHFPYDGFNHGGFHATFQLESDPYVMISDVFEHDENNDGKYTIRYDNTIGETKENAGQCRFSTAILDAEFSKTLPIEQIQIDLKKLNIKTDSTRKLYYGIAGNYYSEYNLVNRRAHFGGDTSITEIDQRQLIDNYTQKMSNQEFLIRYVDSLVKKQKLAPLTYAQTNEEAKQLHIKLVEYLKTHSEYENLLTDRMIFYTLDDLSDEKFIELNKQNGEVVMSN